MSWLGRRRQVLSGLPDAAQIAAFARTLGFGVNAHWVGNPDRKRRIERPFAHVETHFHLGRRFAALDDRNRQALAWWRDSAGPTPALGISPKAANVIGPRHGVAWPDVLPPLYQLLERGVDLHGYVLGRQQSLSGACALGR